MSNDTTHCPECGAPGWDAEERECATCVALGDLADARAALADAVGHEEWGAAYNELCYLGAIIDAFDKILETISDPAAHNRIVDLLNPAVDQFNAAAEQSNTAGGWG